jgi:hypothetical protein
MSDRRTIHIHYTDLDRLILECVHPVLERVGGTLERRYWDRHYAGGPHLRVRLVGGEAVHAAVGEVVRAAERFVAEHPSADVAHYSPERAAEMLRREGEEWEEDDLGYRNNVVLERAHRSRSGEYVSGEAEALAEEFRHDAEPLVAHILAGPRPAAEQVLRLYFLHALLATRGRLPEGAVSFKSHWEGFAAGFPVAEVPERIAASYAGQRDTLVALMLEVEGLYRRGALAEDPLLGAWSDLMARYAERTRQSLRRGTHITPQPATLREASESREALFNYLRRESEFIRVLWDDPRFIAAVQFEPGFLVPRVLVNLLYIVVAAAGLSTLDRMTLCHHAFRTVEDHFDRDLTDILRGNVAGALARSAHRVPA